MVGGSSRWAFSNDHSLAHRCRERGPSTPSGQSRSTTHARSIALQARSFEGKITSKFAIDAGEKIEIELSRDASLVILGRDQGLDVLAQIDANKRVAAWTRMLVHSAEQSAGVRG
jgi:hypothetical protein